MKILIGFIFMSSLALAGYEDSFGTKYEYDEISETYVDEYGFEVEEDTILYHGDTLIEVDQDDPIMEDIWNEEMEFEEGEEEE